VKERPVRAIRIKGALGWIYITDYAGHDHLRGDLRASDPDYIRRTLWVPLEIDETQVYNSETGELERREA
jgi:hypothetical protein